MRNSNRKREREESPNDKQIELNETKSAYIRYLD